MTACAKFLAFGAFKTLQNPRLASSLAKKSHPNHLIYSAMTSVTRDCRSTGLGYSYNDKSPIDWRVILYLGVE